MVVAISLMLLTASTPESLAGLDETIREGMKAGDIPGLAVAVVKDGEIVYSAGFGTCILNKDEPVDGETVFGIASVTKGFTTAALAMVIDRNKQVKLTWDTRLTEALPGMRFADAYRTGEMTVRDLLTHRSGLPAYGADLMYLANDFPREEILRRARYIEPVAGFRDRFGYQNVMYTAAGEIVGRATNDSWDGFLLNQIFLPLEMDRTVTRFRELQRMKNVATPHVRIEEKREPIVRRSIDSAGGAGAISSTVNDLARWMMLHLNQGEYDEKRYWSVELAEEMQRPQVVARLEGNYAKFYPDAHFLCYGLGWFLSDFHGRKMVDHGGFIDGFSSVLGLIPEEKLGVVVLCNGGVSLLPRAVMYTVMDRYLGVTNRDRFAQMQKSEEAIHQKWNDDEKKVLDKRVADTQPSRPMEELVGKYESLLHGEAEIIREEDVTRIRVGTRLNGTLKHFHFDTFLVEWDEKSDGKWLVRFGQTEVGDVRAFRLSELANPGEGEMVYVRKK